MPISANLFEGHMKRSASWDRRRRGRSAKALEMSFHSTSTCANGRQGSMARVTWLSMNLNSRHALRGRYRRQVVSPGGNRGGMVDEFFRQQRHQQLAVEPRLGTFGVMFRHMPQLGQRLETLEDQLDLPPDTIPFKKLPGL